MREILSAANYAAVKHRDQRRKDRQASPYINHPLAVAELLASEGNVSDADLLAAALLHDTVEDTDTSIDELTDRFGSAVALLVAEVTDDKSLSTAARKQLQIEKASGKSDRAKQLKIADKICNIRDIDAESPANWNMARKSEYLDWAVRVIAGCRGVNPFLDRMFDAEIVRAQSRLQDR